VERNIGGNVEVDRGRCGGDGIGEKYDSLDIVRNSKINVVVFGSSV
jgi:hypothetical protein